MGCEEKDQKLKEATLSLEHVKEDRRKLVQKSQQEQSGTPDECTSCAQAQKRLQDQGMAIESLSSDNSKLIQMCSSLADQEYTLLFKPPPRLLTTLMGQFCCRTIQPDT